MSGFLGTNAPLASDLNLVLQAVILLVLSGGVFRVKSRQLNQHGYIMLACTALNTVSVLLVMIPVVLGLLGGSSLTLFTGLVWGHAALGAAVLALSYYVVYKWGLGKPAACFPRRRIMVILSAAWVVEVIGGAVIYLLLYE